MLPILHLNGYKIAGPTVLARIPREELTQLLSGYGYEPFYVDKNESDEATHVAMAQTLDRIVERIREIQRDARSNGFRARPRWPALVLQTPKGWTGPSEVDGIPVEGNWRAHQVPLSELAEKRAHLRLLEQWMRSYRPEELFTSEGKLQPALRALAPKGKRRMGDNPHANGGILLRGLRLPDFREYAVAAQAARRGERRGNARPGHVHPRRDEAESRRRATSACSVRTSSPPIAGTTCSR